MGNSYAELIAAGYREEQILSCPLNDARGKCPCDYAGPQVNCGLSTHVDALPDGGK